jgi:Lrp/AsnC family transcriptional regulator, leucine-responsive regulatory protein
MDLDRFDRQLLNLVQEDAGQTAEQLAVRVALSPSAIQRRLKRLRETGAIQRDIAVLDPKRTGPCTFFIAALTVERERPDLMATVRKWLLAEPGIQQIYYVTGDADFVVVLSAPDVDAYHALMSRLMADCPGVTRFATNVALDVIKRGLTIPIPD